MLIKNLVQAESKKDELKSAQGVQTFYIECRETVSWIEDKKRILQQTDNLEMDLNGIFYYYLIFKNYKNTALLRIYI